MPTTSKAVVAAVAGLALGSGLFVAKPASAHGACRTPTERVSGLTASAKVSCATARAVAAGYDAKLMAAQSFPGSRMAVHGFRCVTNQVGQESEETFSVRCSGGPGTVRFEWGV